MDVVTLALAKKYSDGKFGSSNIWDGVEEAGIINTSTGEDEESTNGRRMPHEKGITVVPGDTYYIKKTTTAKIRYTFYGADGEYIGNTDALGHSLVDSDVMSQKMVPPVGATLFRAFSSGSLVNAGLTVAVGIEADLADVNESISKINRDLSEVTSVVVTSGCVGFVNKQVKYKVKNKIVILSGYFDVTAELPNTGVIFNNLPAEVNDEVVMFTFGKMNSTNIYTGRMPIAGTVYLDSAIPVGTDYYVQASYFTK